MSPETIGNLRHVELPEAGDFAYYVRIFYRHWVGILVIFLASVCLTFGYSLTQPKVYSADARGFISTGASESMGTAQSGDVYAKSRAKSYLDIAKSRATAQTVIDKMHQTVKPESLVGEISASIPTDTAIIRITATASTAEGARQLADAWVSALAVQIDKIENSSPSATGAPSIVSLIPIESAVLPSSPSSPNISRNVALGALAGLALGLGYATIRALFDKRIRSSQQVEEELGLTVIGTIPLVPQLATQHEPRVTETIARGNGTPVGESMRQLRTNLQYANVDDPFRVLVVTSALPAEGKSTVATWLAHVIAANGQKVVLIDADLRRPTLVDIFGLVEGAGLTSVLAGFAKAHEVLQPVAENLELLGAGPLPPNPSELLGTRAMKSLLTELSKDAIVIIDAPPLLPVTDGAVLASIADGAILVTRALKTTTDQVHKAASNLERVHGQVLGVVFNVVTKRDTDGANYGKYGTYYTSGARHNNQR